MDRTDKRYGLCQLLLRYRPSDPGDRAQRDKILSFVESESNCFERSHEAGHITGSAWVLDRTGGKVLLTHHRKLGKWLQLGGHADGHADLLEVARREAREESGLTDIRPVSNEIFDLDVHTIPAHQSEPSHLHYDVRFVFQTAGDGKFKVSDESHELAWVDNKELPKLSNEESLLRMAQKWERMLKTNAGFGISGAPTSG